MSSESSASPANVADTGLPPLGRLDPRARLLAGLLLMVEVLALPAGPGLAAAGILMLLFVFGARLPLARMALAVVAISWMLAFTLVLHAFTTPGHILWQVPGLDWRMTVEGVQGGLLLSGRLAALALLGVSLSLSLSALETVRSLNDLLRPLTRLRVPVGSITLMLGMTLRFVPTLYAEAGQLKRALTARGWSPGRSLTARVRAWIPLFIPLLANSLRRADDLAETLVLRGYDPNRTPASYGTQRWEARDGLVLGVVLIPVLVQLGAGLRL